MHITSQSIHNKWIEYTLTNETGMHVSFLNYGGIITEIFTPNQDGVAENIVLGYKDYQHYERNPNYFGAIIGRVAGRIKKSSFSLDGKVYHLDKNEGTNHLHGGSKGLHQIIWKATPFQRNHEVGVKLSHTSPNGEAGYPGKVDMSVTYTLTKQNEFIIDYEAISDKKTALTLTNHSYFNLTGNLKDTIDHHTVDMNSSHYIELDSELLPTGNIHHVKDTPFDFRHGRKLSDGIQSTHHQNLLVGHGYDHYFLLDHSNTSSIHMKEKNSGRILSIHTNQPGLVLYTANGLDDQCSLKEGTSKKHLGVCFETQAPPASLDDTHLPSVILDANERYKKQTVFSFHVASTHKRD